MDAFTVRYMVVAVMVCAVLALSFLTGCAILNPSPRGEVSSLIAYQAGRKACLAYLALGPYSPQVKHSAEAGWQALKLLTDSDGVIEDELESVVATTVDESQQAMALKFASMLIGRVRAEMPLAKLTPQLMEDIRLGVTEAWEDWTGEGLE